MFDGAIDDKIAAELEALNVAEVSIWIGDVVEEGTVVDIVLFSVSVVVFNSTVVVE